MVWRHQLDLISISDDLLDAIEEGDKSEDTRTALEQARQDFFTSVVQWQESFNTRIQPVLEDAAQEVVAEAFKVAEAQTYDATTVEQVPPPEASVVSPFPLHDGALLRPEITDTTARAVIGLPPLRNPKKKSELWHEVHDVTIPLPSSLDKRVLERPSMKPLVEWEASVRKAQASGALDLLRTNIITSKFSNLMCRASLPVRALAGRSVGSKITCS